MHTLRGSIPWLIASSVLALSGAAAADETTDFQALERDVLSLRTSANRAITNDRSFGELAKAWRTELHARRGSAFLGAVGAVQGSPRAMKRSLFGPGATRAQKVAAIQAEMTALRADFASLRANDAAFLSLLRSWQTAIDGWRGMHFVQAPSGLGGVGGERMDVVVQERPAERTIARSLGGDGSEARMDAVMLEQPADTLAGLQSQAAQMRLAFGSFGQRDQQFLTLFSQWERAIEGWQGTNFLSDMQSFGSFGSFGQMGSAPAGLQTPQGGIATPTH